jgi:hypothetical protein
MRPNFAVAVTRPWHWGIVVVGDPSSTAVPDYLERHIVSAGDSALLIAVRHAQDTENTDLEFAEAEVMLRGFERPVADLGIGRSIFSGTISLPRGRLSVGDADGQVVLDLGAGVHDVLVSVADGVTDHPEKVCIDLFHRPK